MKKICMWAFLLGLLLALAACSQSETPDIVTFCSRYSAAAGEALHLTDALPEHTDEEISYFWSLSADVTLHVCCTATGGVKEARLLLKKLQPDGKTKSPDPDACSAFSAAARVLTQALCCVDADAADIYLQPLLLMGAASIPLYSPQTVPVNVYYLHCYANDAAVVFSVCNRFLLPQEVTDVPSSTPAFDETTNIRTETVPLK